MTLVLPPPNSEGQRNAIESQARYVCVEAGTKGGKTSGAILWILRHAWERPGTRWWWVAPVYVQSKIAWRRITQMLRRAGLPIDSNETELRVTLPNTSVIEFRSGEKPDALYGEDVHGAVIDEGARFREQAFHAVRTTLTATGGSLFIISTPKGRRSWFWFLCQRAKTEPGYAYFHWRTADNPVALADVEDARRALPETVFREQYLGEAQEDEAAVFRGISKCIEGTLEPWQSPPASYVAGVDLGRHENFTVVCIIDRHRRHVVAFDRFTRIDWNLQKQRIKTLLETYHSVGYVDATGPQDSIVEDLQRMGVPVSPFVFTAPSKQQLIEGLAVGIEQRQLTFPDIPELVTELEAFGYEVTRTGYRYAAPEGMHDDCVMALAMAWSMAGPGDVRSEILVGEPRTTAEMPF